jgi:hypothetical protein
MCSPIYFLLVKNSFANQSLEQKRNFRDVSA